MSDKINKNKSSTNTINTTNTIKEDAPASSSISSTSNTINSVGISDKCVGVYSQRLVRSYRVDGQNGRMDFIMDLLKLVRWMASGSMEEKENVMHIIPAVRRCVKECVSLFMCSVCECVCVC